MTACLKQKYAGKATHATSSTILEDAEDVPGLCLRVRPRPFQIHFLDPMTDNTIAHARHGIPEHDRGACR